jgi:CubicO group peptidase (beta-lactamase class C family)
MLRQVAQEGMNWLTSSMHAARRRAILVCMMGCMMTAEARELYGMSKPLIAKPRRLLLAFRLPCALAIVLACPHIVMAGPASRQSAPATPASLEKQIDAIFKEWDSPNKPGASVAVIQKGKIVFAKGYGIANLEYGTPIKPDTIFHVASVSKQFTAMAVVLLETDGKLSIDDEVHKYLPELPNYGEKITIRNLLQHTSGIRDQWQTLALAGWSLEDVITQDQILRLLFRQKELNFPPGTRNVYSNGAFTLLAEIVTRVSGMPFTQFCSARIFTPLKMTHSHFHQDLTQLVPGRAYSYANVGAGYAAAPLNYANVGATSLFTTASDLVKWLDNFRDPIVGGPAGVARMQEGGVLSDGTKINYGLGVALDTYRGQRTVSHGGGDAGYRSQVLWFPEQELGVAVVSNLGSFNPDRIAKSVAVVYIGDKLAPPEAKPGAVEQTFVTLDLSELQKVAGVYPLPKIDQTLVVAVEQGKLWLAGEIRPPFELHPLGPGHFYCKEIQADMEFSPLDRGGMTMKVTQPGAINQGERIPTAQSAVATDLLPYTGVYWSEELETQYTFFLRDGALFARHAHHGEFALLPVFRDQFSSDRWFTPRIKFLRSSTGVISGATLGGGRVTGIAFTRKPGPTLTESSRPSVPVSKAALSAIVGRYDYNGPVLTVTQEGDRVFAQLGTQPTFEIFASSETTYFWKAVPARVTFVKDANGKVVSATHDQGGRTFSAPRLPDLVDIQLDDAQTNSLLGNYDGGSSRRMTITREEGRLYGQVTGQPRFELGAVSETELYLKQMNVRVTVVKDASGRITGVVSHENGADHQWPKLAGP